MDHRILRIRLCLVLAAAVVAAVLLNGHSNWDWRLFAVLTIVAVTSDIWAIESRGMQVAGGMTAHTLAAVLLGPAPAAVIGVIQTLFDWLRRRPGITDALWNFATFAWFPLVSGALAALAVPETNSATEVSLAIAIAFVVGSAINFMSIALAAKVLDGFPLTAQIRDQLLPVMSSETVALTLTCAIALVYSEIGLPAFATLAGVLILFQWQTIKNLTLRDTIEKLETSNLRQIVHTIRLLSMKDDATARHSAAVALYVRSTTARMDIDPEHAERYNTAALLHDIGHYPFSHALEEAGFPNHEGLGVARLDREPLAPVLATLGGPGLAERIGAFVTGKSASPLKGLISGSLDLDKIDYLSRDARMCGVPYGAVDVDRLLASLTLIEVAPGRIELGVQEKGISALESLLFAKYQMYRNVYWHHAVRSATAMYKRLVDEALASGALEVKELARLTDEALLHTLEHRAPSAMLDALRNRRLYKRAFECPAAELEAEVGEWIAADRARVVAVENALAVECGLEPGELLLDYPEKTQMLGLDIPVVRRTGEVLQLTSAGLTGAIHLPQMSAQLYRSARWMRVFTARPVQLSADRVMEVVREGR